MVDFGGNKPERRLLGGGAGHLDRYSAFHLHGHHVAAFADCRGPTGDDGAVIRPSPRRPWNICGLRWRAACSDDRYCWRDSGGDGFDLVTRYAKEQLFAAAGNRYHRSLGHSWADYSPIDCAHYPGRSTGQRHRSGRHRTQELA